MPLRLRIPLTLCVLLFGAIVYDAIRPMRLVSRDQPPDYTIGLFEIRLPRWRSAETHDHHAERDRRGNAGGRP